MTPLEVRIRNLSVVADGAPILSDVELTIDPGEVVGLIGPNGSGKTTLLRSLYRALRPTAGAVLIDRVEIARMPPRTRAQQVAVVAQEHPADFDMRVDEIVAMGRTPHLRSWQRLGDEDRDVVAAAIARVGLAGLESRDLATLSGGERQRALIARALAQRSGVLLLDEPTNHLDIRAQLELLELLGESGTTVVAALHDIGQAARTCTSLVVLEGGRPVGVGRTADVLTPELVSQVFGVTATIRPIAGGTHLDVSVTGLARTWSPPYR